MANTPLAARVARIFRETDSIISIYLVAADPLAPLPAFSAGAHIDVTPHPGVTRQYSLCSDPATPDVYRIGVLLDAKSRGGSRAMQALHEGDVLAISNPRNLFALDPQAKHSVLLGGGIGITPLLAMALALHRQNASFCLHYFARLAQDTAYHKEIASASFADRVQFHFCDEDPSALFEAGRDLPPHAPGTHLYTCGPQGFMAAVLAGAAARGYPENAVHKEHFQPPAPPPSDNTGFCVVQASTGRAFEVPANRTIAEVLKDAGLDIELSCEQGMCGTCLVDVLEGEPDHRDIYQTKAEKAGNERIALCCSRALSSRLVLDV